VIANTQKEYKRIGDVVDDGRKAGLIDWDAIEDRTRHLRELATWASPADAISAMTSWYREDLWLSQAIRIEVWIEKDALMGVAERPAMICACPTSPAAAMPPPRHYTKLALVGFENISVKVSHRSCCTLAIMIPMVST
jgi:hypothetical protein